MNAKCNPRRRLGLVFAGVAMAATFAALPAVVSAQTRDRGARYERATGGSGGSSSAGSSGRSNRSSGSSGRAAPARPSSPQPQQNSRSADRSDRYERANRPAYTPNEFQRSDGRSRTRTNDNSLFNRPSNPSANSRGRTEFRRTDNGDRGDRYERARVAGGRDYGSTTDYRRYDNGRNSFRYARPYGYGYGGYGSPYYGYGAGYGSGLALGFAFRDDFPGRYDNRYNYDRYYGGYGYSYGDDYRYDGGYTRGFGAGGVFDNDPYHVPNTYVAPAYYYYQSYRYTPVYRTPGYVSRYNYDSGYDYAPAYNGYGSVGVRSTYGTSYGSGYGYSTSTYGGSFLTPFLGVSATATDYRPFGFGCAPRTSVSYGFTYATGGPRYYPRYSYAPAYGSGVSVGVQYRSR